MVTKSAVTECRASAEVHGIEERVLVDDDDAAAVQQRRPHFDRGRVECGIGRECHAVRAVERGVTVVQHDAQHGPVGHDDAFRLTRRS